MLGTVCAAFLFFFRHHVKKLLLKTSWESSVERVLQILYFLLKCFLLYLIKSLDLLLLELPDLGKPKIAPVSKERKNLDRVGILYVFKSYMSFMKVKKEMHKISSLNFFGFGDIKTGS